MFCMKCGAKLQDGAVFCMQCGTRIGSAPAQSAAKSPAEMFRELKEKPAVKQMSEKLDQFSDKVKSKVSSVTSREPKPEVTFTPPVWHDPDGEEASSENVAEITFPLEEKTEFTAWRQAATSDPKLGIVTYNDIEAVQAWEEKSNVHIEWQIPPSGQEQENFNLMITSGEYPDMIWDTATYYVGGLDKAIADGVVVPLNKYMDNLLTDYNKLISADEQVYKDCKTGTG